MSYGLHLPKVKYGVFDLTHQSVIYLSLIRSTALPFQRVCRIRYILAKLVKKVCIYPVENISVSHFTLFGVCCVFRVYFMHNS